MSSAASPAAVRPATLTSAEARRRFVDELGQLYAHYGMSLTFGRTFGLLLMSDQPLTLEQIAEQLGVSKTGVSVATRDLERVGIARRLGVRGSKRVLYEASDTMEPLFEAQFDRVRHALSVLQRGDASLEPGHAKRRMADMLALHQFWLQESEGIMVRWRQRRVSQLEAAS